MDKKILCVFPPGWVTSAPYLALPQLKGYTNFLGKDIDIYDDNIEFFDFLFTSKLVDKIIPFCKERYSKLCLKKELSVDRLSDFQILYRGLRYENYFPNIENLKKQLKKVSNSDEYLRITNILDAFLNLVGYFYKMELSLDLFISSTKYPSQDYDSLKSFVSDLRYNIFPTYYQNNPLIEKIESNYYDYIGISITSQYQLFSVYTLLDLLNNKNIKSKIFIGGSFVTRLGKNFKDLTLSKFLESVDFAVMYEGEQLCKQIFSEDFNYKECANVIYMEGDRIIQNPISKGTDIWKLVCPNFDGFPLDKYRLPELTLPLLSSRNCYNECTFCTIVQSGEGNKYIRFDLKGVVENLKQLTLKYKTKNFTFNDEVFPLYRMLKLSELIIRESMNIRWLGETRFDKVLSTEQFRCLYKAGCRGIQFGLESYNQRVLDKMNKKINKQNIFPILQNAMEVGISPHLFAFFGFPTETKIEALNTKRFLLDFLDMAHNKFNLPFASIGYGSFGLEKGSHVYDHPDLYGITIIPKTGTYYDYSFSYDVSAGISQAEARKISNSFFIKRPLTIQTFLPENYLLNGSREKSDSNDENYDYLPLPCIHQLCFNPIDGKTSETPHFYYHAPNESIIALDKSLEQLTEFDVSLLKHYGFFEKNKNNKKLLNYSLNPYIEFLEIKNEDIYIYIDKIFFQRIELPKYYHLILESLKYFGIEEGILNLKKVLSGEEIEELFLILNNYGFIL